MSVFPKNDLFHNGIEINLDIVNLQKSKNYIYVNLIYNIFSKINLKYLTNIIINLKMQEI